MTVGFRTCLECKHDAHWALGCSWQIYVITWGGQRLVYCDCKHPGRPYSSVAGRC